MSDIPPTMYRSRDLNFFVVSRFVSVLAMQVQSVAIGWQIYDIARTPWSLGLVGLCQFIPMFLCTLPAGELTDRFNQRRVYSLAAFLQAGCSALFLFFTWYSPTAEAPFYAVLVLFGAARGFAGPSGQSLLPFLVPAERLPRSISLSSSAFVAAVIVGPALGGFLYAFGHPAIVYGVCLSCSPELLLLLLLYFLVLEDLLDFLADNIEIVSSSLIASASASTLFLPFSIDISSLFLLSFFLFANNSN